MDMIFNFNVPQFDKDWRWFWGFFNPGCEVQVQVAFGDTFVRGSKQWVDLGVSRWKKYHDLLSKIGKKPVLFIMADNTESAKQVQTYLEEKYKELRGKLLELHIKISNLCGNSGILIKLLQPHLSVINDCGKLSK